MNVPPALRISGDAVGHDQSSGSSVIMNIISFSEHFGDAKEYGKTLSPDLHYNGTCVLRYLGASRNIAGKTGHVGQ
jgi:hypothetical protein